VAFVTDIFRTPASPALLAQDDMGCRSASGNKMPDSPHGESSGRYSRNPTVFIGLDRIDGQHWNVMRNAGCRASSRQRI
jgi:hypothetical protein